PGALYSRLSTDAQGVPVSEDGRIARHPRRREVHGSSRRLTQRRMNPAKGEGPICRSPSSHSKIGLSSVRSKQSRLPPVVWSFPKPPRKSLRKAKLSQSAPAASLTTETGCRSTSPSATRSSTRSSEAPRSSTQAKNTSCSRLATCSPSSAESPEQPLH